MKLSIKLPTTRIGKTSLALIVLTFASWLFVNNAQNCLSRDFTTAPHPAICWRATNDYESIIAQGHIIYFVSLILAIICSSAAISKLKIKHSHSKLAENKKTAWFLTALSIILLTFIVTMFEVFQRTTYNNNNYSLNTATDVVVKVGVPLWLVITSSAITYGLNSFKQRNS